MKARESIPAPLRLTLSGPTAIHDATLAAQNFAAGAQVSDDVAAHLAIIVEELVTNLFDHGGVSETDSFKIWLSTRPDGVAFVLMAPGRPFDPRGPRSVPETRTRGRGAGLRLAQAWSGEIDYQYVDGQNHVAVLVPFKSKH